MSDFSPRDDWWQADDGKFYPPEMHPDFQGRPKQRLPRARSLPRKKLPIAKIGAFVRGHWWLPVLALTGAIAVLGEAGTEHPESPFSADVAESFLTPTPILPAPTPTGVASGSLADPVGFGQTFVHRSWQISVVDTYDAATLGVVADEPEPGTAHVLVVYEIAHTGPDLVVDDPIELVIDGVDLEPGQPDCDPGAEVLRAVRAEQLGPVPVGSGRRARLARCELLPDAALDGPVGLRVRGDGFGRLIYFAEGGGEGHPTVGLDRVVPGPAEILDAGISTAQGTWIFTLSGLWEASPEDVQSSTIKTDEGVAYVVLEIEAGNRGAESATSPLVVDGFGARYYPALPTCAIDDAAWSDQLVGLDAEVASGTDAKMALCFEIPSDEVATMIWRVRNPDAPSTLPAYYQLGA